MDRCLSSQRYSLTIFLSLLVDVYVISLYAIDMNRPTRPVRSCKSTVKSSSISSVSLKDGDLARISFDRDRHLDSSPPRFVIPRSLVAAFATTLSCKDLVLTGPTRRWPMHPPATPRKTCGLSFLERSRHDCKRAAALLLMKLGPNCGCSGTPYTHAGSAGRSSSPPI